MEEARGLTHLNMSSIDLHTIPHNDIRDSIAKIIANSQLQSLKLNNCNIQITQDFINSFADSDLIEEIEIAQAVSYPGFEEQIGQLLKKKAQKNKPLMKLDVSKVNVAALSRAVPEPLPLPAFEEEKNSQYSNGFTLSLSECTCTEKTSDKFAHGFNTLSIVKQTNPDFVFSGIFKQQNNLRALTFSYANAPKTSPLFTDMQQNLANLKNTLIYLDLSHMKLGVTFAKSMKMFLENNN